MVNGERPIFEFEEMRGWIISRDRADLEHWLRQFLDVGDSRPLVLDASIATPSTLLYQLLQSVPDERMEIFKSVVYELLVTWTPARNRPQLLEALLLVIGDFRLIETIDVLRALAVEGMLKGLKSDGNDLHHTLLRVLIGFRVSRGIGFLIERDLPDPRYATLLFRASWNIMDDGIHESVKLLGRLFRIRSTDLEAVMDLHGALWDFLSHIGPLVFKQWLNAMIWSVGIDYYRAFVSVLDDIGVCIIMDEEHGYLIRWTLNNADLSIDTPSPFVDFTGEFLNKLQGSSVSLPIPSGGIVAISFEEYVRLRQISKDIQSQRDIAEEVTLGDISQEFERLPDLDAAV